MKLVISEKQLKSLINQISSKNDVGEQAETTNTEAQPNPGTSSDGDVKTNAKKWESGVTRGPANQIGVTKWSDSYNITRGKANPLSEQNANPADVKTYPACVANETTNKNRGQLFKTTSGQYFIKLNRPSLDGYKFYNNNRVLKPNDEIGNYSCNGTNILIDGVDVASQEWNKMKNKYSTTYGKQEYEKSTQVLKGIGELGTKIDEINTEYPALLPIIASVGVGILTGGSSLIVQAIAQLAVQVPFSAYEYKKGDNFGATLGLILAAIPFTTYFKSVYGGPLKALSNGGDDFIKKIVMLKTRERLFKYLKTLKPDSQEAILLSRLMNETPNEFAKAMGEGIMHNLNWLVKNRKIELYKIPMSMRKEWKEFALSLKIAIPSTLYSFFGINNNENDYVDNLSQSIYKDITIKPEEEKALLNWKPK